MIFGSTPKRLVVIDPGDTKSSGNYMTRHASWVDRWIRDLSNGLEDIERGIRKVPVKRTGGTSGGSSVSGPRTQAPKWVRKASTPKEELPKNESSKLTTPKVVAPRRETPSEVVETPWDETPVETSSKVVETPRDETPVEISKQEGGRKEQTTPSEVTVSPTNESSSGPPEAKKTWKRVAAKMKSRTRGAFEGSKMLDETVWAEKLDPRYRSKVALRTLESVWRKDPDGYRGVFEWLEAKKDAPQVKRLSTKKVTYLDEKQRAKCCVGAFGGDGGITMSDKGANLMIKSYSGELFLAVDGAGRV